MQYKAYLIGVQEYQHLPKLQTPLEDIKLIKSALENQPEEGKYVEINLYEDTSKNEIEDLLQKLKNETKEEDAVLFYFAGHGTAVDSEDSIKGYLIPADANRTDVNTFYDMHRFYSQLAQLKCKHLLLVLDCCFAGSFRWSSQNQYRYSDLVLPKVVFQRLYERYVSDPAWQVITSAAYDQKALDVVYENSIGKRNNQTNINSPFAKAFVEAINGKADKAPEDGLITAPELYLYLRASVEGSSIAELGAKFRQTPNIFRLPKKNNDKGEFIFYNPHKKLAIPKGKKENPYKGLSSYHEEDKKYFYGREDAIERLRKTIHKQDITIVTGVSGTGKSSLVRAGLIPILREEKKYKVQEVITINANPVTLLESKPKAKDYDETKENILIIDQYEELLTQCKNPEQLSEFTKKLHELREGEKKKTEQEKQEKTEQKIIRKIDKIILFLKEGYDPKLETTLLPDPEESIERWQESCCNIPSDIKNKIQQQDFTIIVGLSEGNKSKVITELTSSLEEEKKYKIHPVIKPGKSPNEVLISPEENNDFDPEKENIIVIDQYEELFTQCDDVKQREKFLGKLQNAWRSENNHKPQTGKFYKIILIIRADFEPRLEDTILPENKKSVEAWKNARFVIPAFTREELKSVILKPAEQQLLEFKPPEMVEIIIDEVIQHTGALPFLSFTLSELYIKCIEKGGSEFTLTKEAYTEIGGVIRSVTNKADEVYDKSCKKGLEHTFQRILLRMVYKEGEEIAKRRVSIDELQFSEQDKQPVAFIIDALVDARLIIKNDNFIEPSHDALIKSWRKISEWIEGTSKDAQNTNSKKSTLEESYNFLTLRNRLRADVMDKGKLWNNDPRLNLVLAYLKEAKQNERKENIWFNQAEEDFIYKSRKRKRRNTTIRFFILGFFALIALSIGTYLLDADNYTQFDDKYQKGNEDFRAQKYKEAKEKYDDAESFLEKVIISFWVVDKEKVKDFDDKKQEADSLNNSKLEFDKLLAEVDNIIASVDDEKYTVLEKTKTLKVAKDYLDKAKGYKHFSIEYTEKKEQYIATITPVISALQISARSYLDIDDPIAQTSAIKIIQLAKDLDPSQVDDELLEKLDSYKKNENQ